MTTKRLFEMARRIPQNIERKESKSIETMISEIKGEIIQKIGDTNQPLIQRLEAAEQKAKSMQVQIDVVDSRGQERVGGGGFVEVKTIGDQLIEHPNFQHAKDLGFRGKHSFRLKGGAFPIPEGKSTITNTGLGFSTPGLVSSVRLPGVTGLAMQKLRIRNLMRVRTQSTGSSFDWPKQITRTNMASPQVEGALKGESTYLWDVATDRIRTIAHFTNVSRQALDDNPWLRGEIDSELMYGLLLKEEAEILVGSGTGEHLNGIITQATAYDSATYNVAGDTKLDKLRHAKLQARLAGGGSYEPSAFVLHPTDMHTIELIKDQASNVGNYVIGDPSGTSMAIKTVWGLPVVESDSINAGTFLVGAFDTAADLIDRQEATVDISYEHDTNWVKNLGTILCEERVGLAVRKPAAFVYGASY